MTHPKFGVRYTCYKCGVKFYDMNKPEPLCPKCEADQRKAPKKSKPPKAPRTAPVVPDYDDGPEADDDEEDLSGENFSMDDGSIVDDVPDEDEEY